MNANMLEVNHMPIGFVRVADSFLNRMKGFMLCDEECAGYAIAVSPCKHVHTFFLKFPIDVAYCDKTGRVLEIQRHIEPWRIGGSTSKAHTAIEAVASTFLKDVKVGDVIHF